MKRKLAMMLLMTMITIGAWAQTAIKGTVVSAADGEPVIGASVKVMGTNAGTVTNLDGGFTLNVPASAKQLEVSYIGMKTAVVAVKNNLRITLHSEEGMLDEVMVVAYGTAKKSSLTGAIEKIDDKAIEKSIGTSVTGALEGVAPGVQVNNTYGEPGSDPTIRIRGFGSVNGSNSPLYVLDGAIFNGNISDLNANDIESLTVLKDASAAALYGNRAANGVIIITTKKAKNANKPEFTFQANQGYYTRGVKEYKRLASDPWMEMQWQGLKHSMMSGITAYDDATASAYATKNIVSDVIQRNIYDAPDDALFDSNGKLIANRLAGFDDTDWLDAVQRTGNRQEYTASFANSNDKYNVYASVGYLKENGYITNTSFERYNGRVNSTFTPAKWFKGGVNLAVSSQDQNYNSNAYSNYYANPFYVARNMAPIYPIYLHNADGSYLLDSQGNAQYDTSSSYLGNRNVVYERQIDYENATRLTVEAGAFAQFILPYGFDLTIRGNKNIRTMSSTAYNNPNIGDGAANNGRLTDHEKRYETTIFQQQLNWGHDFDKHHVDALLAHESYEYKFRDVYGMNTGMSLAGNFNMINFTTNSYYYGYEDKDATESYLARVRYNYAEKYFGEVSWRTDGSSRFHKDNRWGSFWSIGGAWDFSKEDFLKDYKWLNFGKLRVSFGQVGNNQGIGYYAYQSLYSMEKNGGAGALIKSQLAANDVKWETTQTFDIGIDARLFDRLNLSIGYFDKYSKDLLFEVNLPASAGSYMWETVNMKQLKNIGNVSNRGWEISADYDVIKNRDWKWNVGADITFISNKIKKLPNHDEIANGTKRYAEGHSMYEFYTYHFVGVDQMTGNSIYTLDPEKAKECADAGKLVNINGTDYTLDTTYGKRDWCGSALPKAYGGIHTDVSWKNLSLSMLMTYSLGGKIYDSGYQSLMQTSSNSADAMHEDILNSWTSIPQGMTADSPNRIDANGTPIIDNNLSTYNNATSDRWLTSASYLVMKNITLSYDFPKTLLSKISLTGLTLKAGVENAFTITSRQGINPQYSFSGGQDATYVTARIWNIGLTVKF